MSLIKLTSFLLIAGLILGLRFFLFYHHQGIYHNGQSIRLETVLSNEPKVNGKTQTFRIDPQGSQRITVITSRFPEHHYGEKLLIIGKIEKKRLQKAREVTLMYFPKITTISDQADPLHSFIYAIRQKITDLYEQTLSPIHASLLLGIVFGIKTTMPKDFTQELQSIGVFHVVAASGMNVSMLAGALLLLCSTFVHRRIALLLSIAGVGFYAVLSGFEPSIVRASIMGVLALLAGFFGRQQLGFLGLFATAFIMLFISPQLLFDIGFQLSFLSTLGIFSIKPVFDQKFRKIGKRFVLFDDFATTTASQIATLPILLANFGQYSLLSILANLLVLWTIPILMIIGSIAAIIAFLIQPLGQLILFLSYPFLLYFQFIVDLFSGIHLQFQPHSFSVWIAFGYYCILIGWLLVLNKHSHEKNHHS